MVTYGPKYFKQHLQTNSNFQVPVALWQRDVKMRAVVHYNCRLLARVSGNSALPLPASHARWRQEMHRRGQDNQTQDSFLPDSANVARVWWHCRHPKQNVCPTPSIIIVSPGVMEVEERGERLRRVIGFVTWSFLPTLVGVLREVTATGWRTNNDNEKCVSLHWKMLNKPPFSQQRLKSLRTRMCRYKKI